MDPLDREQPWGPLGQLVLLLIVIGVVFVIFRFAVVIPSWGWQLVTAATVIGALVYYQLAFRRGSRPTAAEAAVREAPAPGRRRAALAALVILGVTAPLWVVLYFLWLGGQVWR